MVLWKWTPICNGYPLLMVIASLPDMMLTWVLFLELEQTKLLILSFGIFEKVHSKPEIWSFLYEHSKLVKIRWRLPFWNGHSSASSGAIASFNIAFKLLFVGVGQGSMGQGVKGQGSRSKGLQPCPDSHDQGSWPCASPPWWTWVWHGAAGECQLGVISQFLSQTGTKYVNFYQESANKAFNFGYVGLK